jgi:peptidoglycan hydrolase-like protein with peptidoglycan-binding domain
MKSVLTRICRSRLSLLMLALTTALGGCAQLDTQKQVAEKAEALKIGPKSAPYKSITNFASGLRCMDNLLLDYGVRDVAVIVEDLADQTKKVNAGTKDMLISAVSDMTRRSRSIRLVAYGQDSGNTVGFLYQALRRDHFAVVPQFSIRGSISQFDDQIVRRNMDAGVGIEGAFSVGVAQTADATVLGIDLTMLTTQDLSVVPGVASRNSVIMFKQGKGFDGEASIRKFGINFSLSTASAEGQTQSLRTLVELASIELFGRLAKVPYWSCLNASPTDPAVDAEVRDWYDSMMVNPSELIEYFQAQMRARRIYDGPIDGVVNPQIRESIARYREALGLSREPKLSLDFFQAYLAANHREVAPKVEPVPAAAAAPASPAAPGAPAAAAAPAPAANTAAAAAPGRSDVNLALQVSTLNNATRFAPGELVQLSVKPNRDAHVACFMQDETQAIRRIFPNRFRKDSLVTASQGLQLPGAMRFELRMNERKVGETVSCLATERDVLPLLPPAVGAVDFDPLPVRTLEQLREMFVTVTSNVLGQEYFHVEPK